MQAQQLQVLKANSIAIPDDAPRAILLRSAADMVAKLGADTFISLRNVEGNLAALRATLAAGTAAEPIVEALKAGGVPMGDNATVGDMMDRIGMEQDEANQSLCHCTQGDSISGDQLAQNLRDLADGKVPQNRYYYGDVY